MYNVYNKARCTVSAKLVLTIIMKYSVRIGEPYIDVREPIKCGVRTCKNSGHQSLGQTKFCV